jgi:hypothetical protein
MNGGKEFVEVTEMVLTKLAPSHSPWT